MGDMAPPAPKQRRQDSFGPFDLPSTPRDRDRSSSLIGTTATVIASSTYNAIDVVGAEEQEHGAADEAEQAVFTRQSLPGNRIALAKVILDAQLAGFELPLHPYETASDAESADDGVEAGSSEEVVEEAEHLAKEAICLAWISVRMRVSEEAGL